MKRNAQFFILSAFAISCLAAIPHAQALPPVSGSISEAVQGSEEDRVSEAVNNLVLVGGDPCASLLPTIQKVVGSASKAKCYQKLFRLETGCRHGLKQRKGNAGNAHAAYGLCSLEASPAIRSRNQRGPDCKNISSTVNQIKCCRAIMRKTPHYFGPVNRRKVARCG